MAWMIAVSKQNLGRLPTYRIGPHPSIQWSSNGSAFRLSLTEMSLDQVGILSSLLYTTVLCSTVYYYHVLPSDIPGTTLLPQKMLSTNQTATAQAQVSTQYQHKCSMASSTQTSRIQTMALLT